jgi:hypothetical protein
MSAIQFFESSLRFPAGNHLPLRATLVRMTSGENILISPIQFDQNQLLDLQKNPPTLILAPNNFHHLHISSASKSFPTAKLAAAPDLQTKRADVAWDYILDEVSWPHHDELQMIFIGGAPKWNECVFYHKATRTLITTDLFFNLKNLSNSFSNILFKIMGSFNKPAVSRLLKILTRDKAQLKKDVSRVLDLDFDRLVMAHGEIIETGAKPILVSALKERGLI